MNKLAIIIGGTGKLGAKVAEIFAEDKYNLILIGRNKEKMDKLILMLNKKCPQSNIQNFLFDISDKDSSEVFLQYISTIKEANILVLNTASGFYKGDFVQMTDDEINKLIIFNFSSIVVFMKSIIETLRDDNSIDFMNITSYNSATNFDSSKSSALHIASKSALGVFSVSLGEELKGSNIRTFSVAPTTFEKDNRKGIPLIDLAKLIMALHQLPRSILVETIAVKNFERM